MPGSATLAAYNTVKAQKMMMQDAEKFRSCNTRKLITGLEKVNSR